MNPNQQAQPSNIPDVPLQKSPIEPPHPKARNGHPWIKDVIGIFLFVLAVIIGAWLINSLVFRSFSVIGPSMEDTLFTGERIIVNRLPVTAKAVAGQKYMPARGNIIVFKNPQFQPGKSDEYIVKRVIGLPGEHVTLHDCTVKVYNDENPDGFNPYMNFKNLSDKEACVSGDEIDRTVGSDEIFVIGDHRTGQHSLDSRNGLGNIPLEDIVGPVGMRIWPLNKWQFY